MVYLVTLDEQQDPILPKVALQLGICKYFPQVIPPRQNQMILTPTIYFVASYDMFET